MDAGWPETPPAVPVRRPAAEHVHSLGVGPHRLFRPAHSCGGSDGV